MSDETIGRWKLIGAILAGLAGLLGILAAAKQLPAAIQDYAALAAALVMFGSRWCESRIPARAAIKGVTTGLFIALGALLIFSACSPTSATWKTTGGVMYAVQATSKGLAAAERPNHDKCLATHGPGAAAYATCIDPSLKRLIVYRDTARPIARNVVGATYAGILIAVAAGKKEFDYIAGLKPGACALILGLREWGHKLPDQGATILPFLALFTGMACDKPAGAAALAILAALLPVAVDLVKWVVHIIGASSDALQKEIFAWLKAPPSDEVDALIRDINAAMPGGV